MMKFHDTLPIEPNWYDHYKDYPYHIGTRVEFEQTNDTYIVSANLSKYYDWAENNGIDMKHSIMRIPGDNGGTGVVSFMFDDESYCMAFKLRWK